MSETSTAEAAASDKTHQAPSSNQTDLVARVPLLMVHWDPVEVIPTNDKRPGEAKAKMVGETMYPDDRPKASIEVWRADNHASVLTLPLQLVSKKIVDNRNIGPSHEFTLDDGIWDDYDKLLYHFSATVDALKKDTTTPLKVKRWHVQGINNNESNAAVTPYRTQEAANYTTAFTGRPDDAFSSWGFDTGATKKADFGKMMKNTYSFNYVGHGCVICGTCQNWYTSIDVAGPDYGKWTVCSNDATHSCPISTHCVDAFPWVQSTDVANKATVPRTPKYLMYSVCCGGAFEPGLYSAYLSRGTKYAIGFKRSTRCDWARDCSEQFFKSWTADHNCNPAKIPTVFAAINTTWGARLEPTLFGDLIGPPSPFAGASAQAAGAI